MPHCVKSGLPNLLLNEIWSVTVWDTQMVCMQKKLVGFFCLGCKD